MVIALSGPSGIGKGYFQKKLLHKYPFIRVIPWFTTRQPRSGEVEKNRICISPERFQRLADAGKLVLTQNLFGHNYGLLVSDLLATDDIALTEIHPENIAPARRLNPDIKVIGLVTSDVEFLRIRLTEKRKTESPSEIETRLQQTTQEITSLREQQATLLATIEINTETQDSAFSLIDKILRPFTQKGGKQCIS